MPLKPVPGKCQQYHETRAEQISTSVLSYGRVRVGSGSPTPLPSHRLHQTLAFKREEILKKKSVGTEKNLISFVRVDYLEDETENEPECGCGECRAPPGALCFSRRKG